VLLHDRHVAEQVAHRCQAHHPDQRTDHVVGGEGGAVHLGPARHEGREGANKRHETRQDDRDAAVLFIEAVGGVEGLAVEPARVLPLEHLGPDGATNGVVDLIPQDRGRQQHGHGHGQAHPPRTRQRSHHEEQRIAGEEGHHHQTGFHEHDQEQQRIDPHAVVTHELGQVLVHVQDEVDQEKYDVHGDAL